MIPGGINLRLISQQSPGLPGILRLPIPVAEMQAVGEILCASTTPLVCRDLAHGTATVAVVDVRW